MLCLASILSSSQLGQCGDYKAHWEVDLGEGVAQRRKCYLSNSLNLLNPSETPRPIAACCAFMPKCHFYFSTSAHCGFAGRGTHHRQRETACGPPLCALCCCCWERRVGQLVQRGYSPAENNLRFFCWLWGLVHSPGFISMTPFLYWLHKK